MQTCFYQAETRQLLSADMLLAITPVPVVESPPIGSSERVPALPLFMESLDLVEALDVDLVLPGHGRPFRQHREVIQRQRERIFARKNECLSWIEAGFSTPAELLDKMYAHRPIQMRFAGLWMLVGYLDLLMLEGAVEQRTINEVWHYFPRTQRSVNLKIAESVILNAAKNPLGFCAGYQNDTSEINSTDHPVSG